MSSPVSEFAEKLVFGGQFPRGDPEALRRLAATWREIATGAADVRASVAGGIQNLAGAVDVGSHVGRAVHESGAALTKHSEQLSGFAVAVADWLDDVANDVELAITEMSLLVLMVLCAGTSVAAAAQARARFLALLEGLVGRIGAGSAAVTMARAGLFVAEGVAFGAAQAGLNMGIQLAQPTRHGVDWALVGTAGLAGVGSAMGGRLGAGVVAKVVGKDISAGWGRAIVAAGAGVFGALGGAVAIGRLDSPVTQLISGGVLGLAAHTISAARQGAPPLDAPTGTDAKSVAAERLLIDGKSAAAERLLFSESIGDGESVARLAQLAEQGAREQLMALSSGDGSSVELVGPAGPGRRPGGDGAFLADPNSVAGQPESRGIFWLNGFDGGGGDGGYAPTRPPGDGGGARPSGPEPGGGLPAELGGYSTTDRAGTHRMSVFGAAARGGDSPGTAPASMNTDLGLSSVWRDAGGAVPDGSVAKPEAQSGPIGVLERNPLRELGIRTDTAVELGESPAIPPKLESPATPSMVEPPATRESVESSTSLGTVEPPTTLRTVEPPASLGSVESPATRATMDTSATPGRVDSSATPTAIELPATPGRVDSPAAPGTVESPAAPGTVESPATPGTVESPGTPTRVELPGTPTRVELPATSTRVESPATPPTVEPPATSRTAATAQQPSVTRQGGAATGGPGWVPAMQPWGPVAPDPNSPGAPDDPTLRPPELDETNPHPHVLARPGAVQSPSDPDDLPRPAAPVSDVPPTMPNPVEPIRFRAANEPGPTEPAHENAGAAASADPGGSTDPGRGDSAAGQTGVPAAAPDGTTDPGRGDTVGGQPGVSAAPADGTTDQSTTEQTEVQLATQDGSAEPTEGQDIGPVEPPPWLRSDEYADATSNATADERFLDPMRLVFETAEIRAAEPQRPPSVSVLGVESSTGTADLLSPSTAMFAFGDMADVDEVWGFVPDPAVDWTALPAMVHQAADLYAVVARRFAKAAVVTVVAYDPSGGALDSARRDRAAGELALQLLSAASRTAGVTPRLHLVGTGAGAEIVRVVADVLDSDIFSTFVKDVGDLPLVTAIVRRGQVVSERGHADRLFERYAEREQRLREAGAAYARVVAGAVDQDEEQSAAEYDRRQIEFVLARRELQTYVDEGVVERHPLPAGWHPEQCSTVDEVIDGLRRGRGVEFEVDSADLDPAAAREMALAILDHGATAANLYTIRIGDPYGVEGVSDTSTSNQLGGLRSSALYLNREYVDDPDLLRAAWQALVEANPRLVVPDRPVYCLVVAELGNVLVEAGRWRAEKYLPGLLRELWMRTRGDAESFADWGRKQLNAEAFYRDGTLDVRAALVASHFAVRIDRANASLAELEVHDLIQRMARVWSARHSRLVPPTNESERAQTLVNMALGEAMARAHGAALLGFEIPGLDSASVRELVTTVRATLVEHPQIRLVESGFAPLRGTLEGTAYPRRDGDTPLGTSLMFQERLAISRELARIEAIKADAEGRFRGGADDPMVRLVQHELGHGLSNAGGRDVERDAVNLVYGHYEATRGADTGYEAWVVEQYSGYGIRVNMLGERDPDEIEAPAEAFVQVSMYSQLPAGTVAEPTEGEWLLYQHLVLAAERAELEYGPPTHPAAPEDPNVVSPAADRAREALARRLTKQRLALVETTRKAGDLEESDGRRRQLELIDRLAAARLRAALAHATADGPAEYDWAQALDILDQKLVALVAAANAVDATAAPNHGAGNCAVSSLLTLRDLFPDSDIRVMADERRLAGTDLGKIIAAAGGAPEDLSRAELRARLLDPADPAEAALVLTQWKVPDDKGSQGHVELAVNQRDGEVAKEDGTVLSVDESRVRDFSTDTPREAFQHLVILFDANGRPLRPLDPREREEYATRLQIPHGHTPSSDWPETIAGLRELLRSWTDIGSTDERADLEHWIDLLEEALRGATVLREHAARQLVARAATAPIPGLFQGAPDLLELERLRQNARARLVELLPPGPVSTHLEALHAHSRRYSPEVNELYRHYRGVDESLSLAETFGECAHLLADLRRVTQEIGTAAGDARQQADLVAQTENEIAERLAESRDPTSVVERLNRLRDRQIRGFEELYSRLQTQAEAIEEGGVLTAAVAGLRGDAGDEFGSLRADLADILAAGGFDGDIDKALSKDSRVRRYLARDLELATSAVINALAQAARIELLPTELTDPDRVADIADVVHTLTADGRNETLATAWGVFAQTFDELQVIAGCDRLRSRIQVIDTMERALLDARMAFTEVLDQPGPVLDDAAARYLRMLSLVYRVDRWATTVQVVASRPVLPGLEDGWVEQMSVKYALPHEQLQPGRDIQRRLLSKLRLTHDRLRSIIDTDPADLTAAQLQEQTRPPDEQSDAAARVPYSADLFHVPTGFEWEGLADQDADWLLFKDALVQEYLELRQYADWGRAAHQRRGELTVLNTAVDDAVADAALDLSVTGQQPPPDGPEDRARRDRLGASLFALRGELVGLAARAAQRFSDASPGTGIESITQLWPGSSAAWELEELSEELRAQIARRVSADPDLMTWQWAEEQLLEPSAALSAQPDLLEALESYHQLELLLNLAADFHRAESWVRAIDAVDAGLVQARLWRDRDTGPGFGWDARLTELTDLAWHLDIMARTREELIAEAETRQEAWEELGDLDDRLDVEFAKAGSWGAGANRRHIVLNAPLTCLVVMFHEAAQGDGPRPGFRIPEEQIDEIVLSGVDGHDAARWAGANWRRFRDVTAAFEWVSESPRSERAAGLRRTAVLSLDYQPIDANAGANAVLIKVDDNGRVVAAEPELQHDDAGNPVVGVRHIEGDDAVRAWAAMLSADAAAAGVHALAFEGDVPVDPLHGMNPDNAGNRQIPRGRIHGPPPGPDPDAAASPARADATSRSDTPAVRVVRPRAVKKLTGVDLGIMLASGSEQQERPSSSPAAPEGVVPPEISATPAQAATPADVATLKDVATPDPVLAAALAQRPHSDVIVLSGDLATVAERARAINEYIDGRGVQRERLVLVAIPESTPTLAAAIRANGPDAVETQVARALFEDVDDVVVVPDDGIADGVLQLSAMLGEAVSTATAAGVMAVLHNGGVVPGITGEGHDLRGRRVSVVAADIRVEAPTGSRPETPWSTPDRAVAAGVGGTPWSTRSAPAAPSDPPTVRRPDRPAALEIGGVRVDLPSVSGAEQRAARIFVAGSEVPPLNSTATRLLARVMAEPGRIVPWDILQRELVGAVGDAPYQMVNRALHDVRQAIGSASIVTVSGFGLRFDGVTDRIVVETDVVEAGPIRLERAGRRVFVDDQLVELGRLEFDLLEFALRNQSRIVSWATMRRTLPAGAMPRTRDLDETSIAVRGAFVQLRRKIPDLPPALVVRELGCRFGSATGGVVLETTESGDLRLYVNGRAASLDSQGRVAKGLPAYALIRTLIAQGGRIVSPQTIIDELYGGVGTEEAVRSLVAAVRRRLGAQSIATVKGFGWRFDGVGDRVVVDEGAIEVAGVRLEPPGRRVFVDDELIAFGRLEFDLLELLMRNAGRISGWQELRAVVGTDGVSDELLGSQLQRLRLKLGGPTSIALVPGFGWRFDGIGAPVLVDDDALVIDGLRWEPHGRRVFHRGVLVDLTRAEFDVLALLMANAGRVVPRTAFLGEEWTGEQLDTRSLMLAVTALRNKLGDTDPRVRRIKYVEGIGFRFETDLEAKPDASDADTAEARHESGSTVRTRHGIRVETAPPQVFIDDETVELGPKQLGVLRTLIGSPSVVTYQELATAVWDNEGVPIPTVQRLVEKVRARIGDTDRTDPRIESVRGVGYRFNDYPPQ
ncbi:winged helix-turn-helix domain-containing protein [Nocardia sp. NPDC049149]|uniref:winged helix-turn-helix domain-containing protein n=1 Tax=Nocardia sp. NPDC049149 TaxID=3364315 RepID=UPI003722CB7B